MILSPTTTPPPSIGIEMSTPNVGAGDLGLGGEAGARAAVGVRAEAVELQLQGDRLGVALDGQLAVDEPVAVVLEADAGGAEGHVRVVLDVEEVGGADVRVTLLLTGVDRAQVDGRGDDRLRRVLAR